MLHGARRGVGGRVGRRGLTLVELLVSIGLTIFLLTLFAVLFQSGNNAVTNARGVAEIDRQVRGAITRLRRDLEHVYLGDGVSLAHIYERYGPQAGYFTIEENMPGSPPFFLAPEFDVNFITDAAFRGVIDQFRTALAAAGSPTMYRQGIDARGLPVEMDVDDVLAFTVRLPGTSRENIFVGRVPKGSVLDNGFNPESRFDQPNNGLFTSPLAEVVYFLRPDRPYRLSEMNNPALGASQGRLIQTPTFTLYRRELLLLTEGQRRSLETPRNTGIASPTAGVYPLDDMQSPLVQALNPGLVPGSPQFNPSFYQHYDVSAYFGYDGRIPPSMPGDLVNLANFTLRWNSPETIRQRCNRYGMQWLGYLGPAGDWTSADLTRRTEDPDGAAPNYDHIPVDWSNFRGGFRTYAPISSPVDTPFGAAGSPWRWHGRPTLFESTLIGSEGFSPRNYDPTIDLNRYAGLIRTFAASGHLINGLPSDAPSTRRRSGGDVLLQNVLSFDVKVLNDDVIPGSVTAYDLQVAGFPDVDPRSNTPVRLLDDKDWPAFRSMLLAPRDPALALLFSRNQRAAFPVGNASRPAVYQDVSTPSLPPSVLQPDFVDLGMTFLPEWPARPPSASPELGWPSELNLDPQVARYYLAPGFAVNPSPTEIASIPWGRQTPARWMTTGRRESSSTVWQSAYNPLRSTYDTWAPEYNPENFSTRFSKLRFTPSPEIVLKTPPDPPAYTPPYDRPLRGIQISIRVLEPKSGIEREFRLVHRFD